MNKLKGFKKIYKKRFGKKIDRNEAYEQGVKLMRLVELVYKPISQQEYNKLITNKYDNDANT